MTATEKTASTDCYGRALPTLTREEVDTVQGVLKAVSATRGRVKSLDMGDPCHRRFVLDRLGGEDFLERYFPSVRNLVDTARSAHEASGGAGARTLLEMEEPANDQWHPMVSIAYIGLDPNGVQVVAQGIVTLPGVAASITSNLMLVNQVSGQVLATVTVPTQFNHSSQVTNVTGALPHGTPPQDIVALLTTQYLEAGAVVATQATAVARLADSFSSSEARAGRAGADETEGLATPIQSMTVLNPNHNAHPQRDYIKVGLNRTPGQVADCDYYYEFGNSGSKPIVGLQVNGSAALIPGYTVASSPNFNGACILTRRSGVGGGATLAFPSSQIPSLCSGAGGSVGWNIGPNWFQGAPWEQGDVVDLDFTLNFAVSPSGTASLRVTSVAQGVGTPPPNIASIAPIMFVWGCVAAGTLVRMADGGQRRIETLRAGERVADGQGGSLRIKEVWKGHEAEPLYRLATPSGAEALVTEGHAVPTGRGVMAAGDLEVGMTVTTFRGEERLSIIERVSHDGAVVNLDLLPEGAETLDEIDDDSITAFEAGGILVGDNRMQGVLVKRAQCAAGPDPLETLGPEWRLDIVNSRRIEAGLRLIERLSA